MLMFTDPDAGSALPCSPCRLCRAGCWPCQGTWTLARGSLVPRAPWLLLRCLSARGGPSGHLALPLRGPSQDVALSPLSLLVTQRLVGSWHRLTGTYGRECQALREHSESGTTWPECNLSRTNRDSALLFPSIRLSSSRHPFPHSPVCFPLVINGNWLEIFSMLSPKSRFTPGFTDLKALKEKQFPNHLSWRSARKILGIFLWIWQVGILR